MFCFVLFWLSPTLEFPTQYMRLWGVSSGSKREKAEPSLTKFSSSKTVSQQSLSVSALWLKAALQVAYDPRALSAAHQGHGITLWALVTTNRTHSHKQAEAPVPDLQRDQKMPQGHFLEQVLHSDWLPTHLLEV